MIAYKIQSSLDIFSSTYRTLQIMYMQLHKVTIFGHTKLSYLVMHGNESSLRAHHDHIVFTLEEYASDEERTSGYAYTYT
jgi:hypothetical protein